jgi:hypothetical protein
MSKIKESELLSTAFRKQEFSLFPDWPYFIRSFILYKLEKHPLTCDFYAKMKAECNRILLSKLGYNSAEIQKLSHPKAAD